MVHICHIPVSRCSSRSVANPLALCGSSYLLPTSSPGAISKQHLQFLSQRLENWGAQAIEGTWELYDLARHDIVIYLDSQPSPRSFMRKKVIPKPPGCGIGEISAITCRTATKLGEPKQRSPPASSIEPFVMILPYTVLGFPARPALAHEKKSDPGITFSSICVSTQTHFPKNNTVSVVNTKNHYAQEKQETQSFTTVPVSLDNSNGARRTVCLKITTRFCVTPNFSAYNWTISQPSV